MKILHHKLWTKPLAAILGLSFLIPFTAAEARVKFNAPSTLGVPGRRVAGGAREMDNKNCLSQPKPLTAVVPASNIGLTTLENPTLFFYVPLTSAPALEFVVLDENKSVIKKQIYKPSDKAGVFGIPVTGASLEVGKQYSWFFSIICNPKERSKDKVVQGAIKRIKLEPQLSTKLENASPQERVNLYAAASIWQDSLTTLAQLLYARPNDEELKADWKALLTAESVGLDKESRVSTDLVNEPLIQGQEAPQPL